MFLRGFEASKMFLRGFEESKMFLRRFEASKMFLPGLVVGSQSEVAQNV